MQKAARRRRYLRNKRKKAFKRMMLYTALAVTGLVLVWHPVDASTLKAGESAMSPGSSTLATSTSSAISDTSSTTATSPVSATSATTALSASSASSVMSATSNGNSTAKPQAVNSNADPIEMLSQSFNAIHAKQTDYILHNYSTVNHQFTEVKKLSNLGSEIVQELNVQNAKVTQIARADDVFYNVDGFWPNQTEVQVTVSSFRDSSNASTGQSNGTAPGVASSTVSTKAVTATSVQTSVQTPAPVPGITTLAVSVTGNGSDYENIKEQYQMMGNAVKKVGVTPEMNACLEGYLDDRIVGVQAKDIVSRGFAAIHAAPVEGLYSGLETSVSGYTNNFNTSYITTDGKRMNVQLAVHADDYNHRTNVLVGTPIITTTY